MILQYLVTYRRRISRSALRFFLPFPFHCFISRESLRRKKKSMVITLFDVKWASHMSWGETETIFCFRRSVVVFFRNFRSQYSRACFATFLISWSWFGEGLRGEKEWVRDAGLLWFELELEMEIADGFFSIQGSWMEFFFCWAWFLLETLKHARMNSC